MLEESPNDNNLEIMPVPEIEVKRERGIELLSGFLAEQKEPLEDNDEAMEWIALSYSHPEYKNEILNKIRKDKLSIVKNPEELYEKTINFLKEYEKNAPPLDLSDEMKKREELVPKYREHIEKLIKYFHPDPKTSDIKKVVVIPSDRLLSSKNTGRAINIGDVRFIMSHTDNDHENLHNFNHEFLHGFINPITEKFSDYFNEDEQKQKIIKFTAGGIKGYGGYPVSILNEEIINIYVENIKDGRVTFSKIKNEINEMSEEIFLKIQKNEMGENIGLQKLFGEFKDINDLRNKSEFFYKEYIKRGLDIKNELRKRLLGFYKGYESEKESNPSLSFEKYFLDNYKKILD